MKDYVYVYDRGLSTIKMSYKNAKDKRTCVLKTTCKKGKKKESVPFTLNDGFIDYCMSVF